MTANSSRSKPRILLTLGDAAGIGPEVLIKALAQKKAGRPENAPADFLILGELDILQSTAESLGFSHLFCDEASQVKGSFPVKSFGLLRPGGFALRQPSAPCGDAAYRYFIHAIDVCLAGEADAIVTAPISKEGLQLAGHPFVGHTDILEKRTGADGVVMALVHPKVMVSHVTDHMSLRQALDAVTVPRLKTVVKLTWNALLKNGIRSPRIALAGVNPHAGENGLFGREELDILIPAMQELEREGFPTFGPLAGDTVFREALLGRFDGVLAMYHDQGFGPMKTLDFKAGVNCTLGLPFVRTSPDHGTAYDIAGSNQADPDPMVSALDLALRLAGVGNLNDTFNG